MTREVAAANAGTLHFVSQLLEAGNLDSVYRDLYLQRARTVFAPLLPESAYLRFEQDTVAIDNLLRQNRAAVDRGDWRQVKELTDRIRALRILVNEKRSLLTLGHTIYDVADIPLDPFSPGFQALLGMSERDLAAAQERAVGMLAALEKADPAWQAFYVARRSHFQHLSLAALASAPPVEQADPRRRQHEALQALDRGDLDLLARLAEEVLEPPSQPQAIVPPPQAGPESQRSLSPSFSDVTLASARRLSLVPAQVESAGEFSAYLSCCCVWRLTFPDRPLTEGRKSMKGCTCGHPCPPTIPPALKENLDLFMVHPFVNSGGARYLPRFAAEQVLVEDFPEGEAGTHHSELLAALGLKKRTAISRIEIERALLQHGPQIVKDSLRLEPQEFRLVCIPFDVYSRLGPTRGWGQRQFWTHFDGYQVLEGSRLRALVGGDIRYGGIYDLASISRADEREGVTARFTVVRRERLTAVSGVKS